MKRLYLLILILFPLFVFSQEDNKYFSEPELDNQISKKKEKKKTEVNTDQRFRFALYAGYSFRTTNFGYILPQERRYYLGIRNGLALGGDIQYFIKNRYGIGLNYQFNYFGTRQSLEFVDSIYVFHFTEKLNFNQISPTFTYKYSSKRLSNSNYYFLFGIGYIRYEDRLIETSINQRILTEIAQTYCWHTRFIYDFGINDKLTITAQIAFWSGNVFQSTIIDNATGQAILYNYPAENSLDLSRVELSVGIKFGR